MSRDLPRSILTAGAPVVVTCETPFVTLPVPMAPSALESPLLEGTRVELDAGARFVSTNLVAGGSPWRLLHLPGASRTTLERWREGGVVRAGEGPFARTLVQQGLVRTYRDTPWDLNDLDVVIPVRDASAALGPLLDALAGLHVTVVDDGSLDPDALRAIVEARDATLHRHDHSRGPGAARNTGLRATTRPLVAFIDADVDLDDGVDLVRRLGALFHDPLVGAVAPRIRGRGGPSRRDGFEARFSPLDRGGRSGLVRPHAPVNFVPSALLLVRRASVGEGFDESLLVGEDVDLVWRLHDQGWLVRYEASVVATHRARPTWSAWWAQRVRYGASSAELSTRHGGRLAPVRVDPVTAGALVGLLVGRPALTRRVLRVAERHFARRLPPSTEGPERVAREIVSKGVARASGPLARALVRTYGPLLVLGLLHPRLRRRLLVVLALGVGWRWRRERFRLADLPLALADDLAYASGLAVGSWRTKTWRALVPELTPTSLRWRDFLPNRGAGIDAADATS